MRLMKNTQLYRHEPQNEIPGDCYRTSIACLLGMPAHLVPHFVLESWRVNKTTEQYTNEWLADKGWLLSTVWYTCGPLLIMEQVNPNSTYLLSGKSPRGKWSHVVIAKGGTIIWDTAPKDALGWGTLDGPCPENDLYQIEILSPIVEVP